MSAPVTLTPTAKRDLLALAGGQNIRPRYGPLVQLIEAGYATADLHGWDTPRLTTAGREAAEAIARKRGTR